VVAVLSSAGLQVPVIPLVDVVGRAESVAPEQMAATGLKVGVVLLFTLIVKLAVVAHCPASGVKVYVVVAVLSSAGLQVPVIPLVDVVGRAESVASEQMAATGLKVGTVLSPTVIVSVAVVAHWPASGVKVYVVVAVLSSAGLQVPVMPLVDVVGRAESVAPEQMATTGLKVGTVLSPTVIVSVAVVAHWPASGVKV
jgi:hypothetical protein